MKLYCIVFVLCLYIYIALLEVHTNQQRFQCEIPREKRAVFRERKEALDSLVNKVDHVKGGSCFQNQWLRRPLSSEGNGRREMAEEGKPIRSRKYLGAWPICACTCIALYCVVLHCIALYCIVLYYMVLYCIALYCIILHCIVFLCVVLLCIILHCTVLHDTALHCIVLHCIDLYCIVLYCIALHCIACI